MTVGHLCIEENGKNLNRIWRRDRERRKPFSAPKFLKESIIKQAWTNKSANCNNFISIFICKAIKLELKVGCNLIRRRVFESKWWRTGMSILVASHSHGRVPPFCRALKAVYIKAKENDRAYFCSCNLLRHTVAFSRNNGTCNTKMHVRHLAAGCVFTDFRV